jgi:SAM-dependent methyltransferase
MTTDPRADLVADQYQRWVYPAPIEDLPGWLASNWQWFDPSHAHRNFWPDRDYTPDMKVLVAGCGTSQAAVLAYTNPSAHVVAIDVSQTSLEHHRHLKTRYGLNNLDLHLMPIEQAGELRGDFDLIVSTGVLHHLADPDAGARVLGELLNDDGVLALMLYARYGRLGVEMLQSVFRELGLRQDEASITVVRQALDSLPPDHPVRGYLTRAPDLGFDAGLVDTFLHGRDRSYTVHDCLDLVSSAGLTFQEWFLKSPYEPNGLHDNAFVAAVSALPDAARWSAMEQLNAGNARHFFTACTPQRPAHLYRISFEPERRPVLVPHFRYRCSVEGDSVVRPGWHLPLTPEQLLILQEVDGRSTISDITQRLATTSPFESFNESETSHRVAEFLEHMWKRDFVNFTLK